MEVIEKLPDSGFDCSSFWQQADSILLSGKREMLRNVQSKNALISAYCKMDRELMALIDQTNPPEETIGQLRAKLHLKLGVVGWSGRNALGNDPAEHYEGDMKASALIVLRAAGAMGDVVQINELVRDAVSLLCGKGNFTRNTAAMLIKEMAAMGCRNLDDALGVLGEGTLGKDFADFVRKAGTPKAREALSMHLASQTPIEPKSMAKVIRLMPETRPMRPITQR